MPTRPVGWHGKFSFPRGHPDTTISQRSAVGIDRPDRGNRRTNRGNRRALKIGRDAAIAARLPAEQGPNGRRGMRKHGYERASESGAKTQGADAPVRGIWRGWMNMVPVSGRSGVGKAWFREEQGQQLHGRHRHGQADGPTTARRSPRRFKTIGARGWPMAVGGATRSSCWATGFDEARDDEP